MSLFAELKRRNVFRVGAAYVVTSWLLIQVAETIFPLFGFDDAPARIVVIVLAIGLIPTLVFAWAFELTPEGLKRESEVERSQSITPQTGKKLDRTIMTLLALALAYFALDKFVLDPMEDTQIAAAARQEGRSEALNESGRDKTIAVIPFANRSSVEEDAYFVDGIHDDVLTRLAKIRSLKVISRTSVMRYRDTEKSVPEIARELDAAYILEGGVQRAGQKVRITAQLIDAAVDEHLWAETFDRELSTENLFAIQSEIARAIASALDAELTPKERLRLDQAPTDDLQAYDAYLLGRQGLLSAEGESCAAAVGHFKRAAELDTQYAAAFAGICEANLCLYNATLDTANYDAAKLACDRALQLDSELVEVHVALGRLYRTHGDYANAEAQQRLALAASPEDVDALIELGMTLAVLDKTPEAESTLRAAEGLQPDHWPVHEALFTFYRSYSDRPDRYGRAVAHATRLVELLPNSTFAWNNLGTAYHSLEQFDLAKSAWDHALALEPSRTAYTNRGLEYYYEGRYQEAAEMQLKAVELAPEDHRVWGRLAESYRQLGGRDQEADQAYAEAIRLAEATLKINDKDWRTLGMLAIYYAYSGRPEDAQAATHAALTLSDNAPEILLYAALVAHRKNDTEAVLKALEEMITRDPSFRRYAANDPDLMSLKGNERFDRLMSP